MLFPIFGNGNNPKTVDASRIRDHVLPARHGAAAGNQPTSRLWRPKTAKNAHDDGQPKITSDPSSARQSKQGCGVPPKNSRGGGFTSYLFKPRALLHLLVVVSVRTTGGTSIMLLPTATTNSRRSGKTPHQKCKLGIDKLRFSWIKQGVWYYLKLLMIVLLVALKNGGRQEWCITCGAALQILNMWGMSCQEILLVLCFKIVLVL